MAAKFEPKTPVQLDPPKDDPISLEELAKADGKCTFLPCYRLSINSSLDGPFVCLACLSSEPWTHSLTFFPPFSR